MKKIIGILCCFGFLLFAGTFETKASETIHKQSQYENVDVGRASIINNIPGYDLLQFRQKTQGVITVKYLNLQSDSKKIPNDAFCPRYNLVPECQQIYIKVRQFRYSTHYIFTFNNSYNPPPGI